MRKSWYIVKTKMSKRWTAYELTTSQAKQIEATYETRGPFKSLVKCLIKANRKELK